MTKKIMRRVVHLFLRPDKYYKRALFQKLPGLSGKQMRARGTGPGESDC
jgi:hypothetical protein